MSKRQHDQRGDAPRYVCKRCKADQCNQCVDIMRAVYAQDSLCNCRRKNHNGEPADQQIVDPFTNAVHSPGLRVDVNGEVKFYDRG